MALQKSYQIKVFGPDGATAKGTVDQASLRSIPSFRGRINGAQGELVLDLVGDAYKFDAYGEGTLVRHMNVVEMWVTDAGHPLGRRVYKGFISRYAPYVEQTGQEGVRVTCLGLGSLLTRSYLGGFTGVTYTTKDPEFIVKAVIDDFNAVYGGSLLGYAGTTQTVGTNVTYAYKDAKWFDAIGTAAKLAGSGWWWFVDQDGNLNFKAKPSSATWSFTVGLDVNSVQGTKDAERVVNDLEVRRSGGTARDYSDATSQSTYGTGGTPAGKSSEIVSDTSISDATTSDQRGAKEIADKKDAKVSAVLVLNPSADLEGIKIGDTCQILNRTKSDTTFNANMQIVATTYTGDALQLELEQLNADLGTALSAFVNG